MILLFTLVATLVGGVLSVLAAGLVSLTALARYAPRLIGFSVGVLVAAAFLDLLPEAAGTLSAESIGAAMLAGLAVFFVLEKFALWRHDHGGTGHPTVAIIVLGDSLHNFVDGLLIAAAFTQDLSLGITTAVAVVLHEIPQEVGDFMVLLACGVRRARALWLNALSGLAMVLGGLLGHLMFQDAESAVPYMLALAAASFIYIAIADLVPALQRDRKPLDFPIQLALLASGAGVIVLAHG